MNVTLTADSKNNQKEVFGTHLPDTERIAVLLHSHQLLPLKRPELGALGDGFFGPDTWKNKSKLWKTITVVLLTSALVGIENDIEFYDD